MVSVIESYDESKIKEIEIKLDANQKRLLEIMESSIKINEKASDAIALSRETAALAKGSQREVEAALNSIRSEVKAQTEGLNEQMKALRKATTNPLGR